MAIFELCDTVATGPEPDLLGLWTPVQMTSRDEAPAGATAFAVSSEETVQMLPPLWRANYPAEPARTAEHLEQARAKLMAADAALAIAPPRLDSFVAGQRTGLAYSFSTSSNGSTRAEEELLLLLSEIQGSQVASHFGVDYGLTEIGQQASALWREAIEAFQAFSGRLGQMMAQFAWVETRVAGQLMGMTRVTWTGDADTFFEERLTPGQMRLHRSTLDAALTSRQTLLRTSTLVISGAIKLSVLLATPGGVVAAFPAMLRFINQVRRELEYRQRQSKEAPDG
jgi:hypothetical protein